MNHLSHEPQHHLQDGNPNTLGPSTDGERRVSTGSRDQHGDVQRTTPGVTSHRVAVDNDEDFERQFRRASPYNLR